MSGGTRKNPAPGPKTEQPEAGASTEPLPAPVPVPAFGSTGPPPEVLLLRRAFSRGFEMAWARPALFGVAAALLAATQALDSLVGARHAALALLVTTVEIGAWTLYALEAHATLVPLTAQAPSPKRVRTALAATCAIVLLSTTLFGGLGWAVWALLVATAAVDALALTRLPFKRALDVGATVAFRAPLTWAFTNVLVLMGLGMVWLAVAAFAGLISEEHGWVGELVGCIVAGPLLHTWVAARAALFAELAADYLPEGDGL